MIAEETAPGPSSVGPRSAPSRVFATAADQPRSRRATDVIALALSGLGLVLVLVIDAPQPGFARAIGEFVAAIPSFVDGLWQIAGDLLVAFALVLLIGCLVGRRNRVARDLLVAAVLALVIGSLLQRWLGAAWPELDSLRRAQPPPTSPYLRLAVPGAMIVMAAPHVVLPLRRVGRVLLALATLGAIALGAGTTVGVVAGLLLAVAIGAFVHLVFGSSAGHPSLAAVRAALEFLGVAVDSLAGATAQPAGLFVVDADDGDESGRLVVKVYGRDAHGAAIVSTLWRTVWFREPGSSVGFGRRQQVEHEAFLTLLARQAGVPTDTVVTAGVTDDDDALLVLRRTGQAPGTAADISGTELWSLLARLHRAGIGHGAIDADHLVIDDGVLGLIGFRQARIAARPLERRQDEAQALLTLVLAQGRDNALDQALAGLGPQGLAAVLPYIQPATLTPSQRRAVRSRSIDLDQLRAEGAARAGVEAPPQQELRRFTVGSMARVVLPVLAVFGLVAALSGFELDNVWRALGDASWALVILGFLVAQLPRVSQTISTLGAAPVGLPMGPVYVLQLAISYINLAVPTSAARVAVNIRFFQRQGVPPGGALAAGALDGVSGFFVQVIVLAGLLALTPLSLALSLRLPSTASAPRLLLVVLVLVAAVLGITIAVGNLRRFVVGWIRQITTEALSVLRGLRSPRRLGMLFGGNLLTDVFFALALGAFTRAFGGSVGFGELLLVVISVGLLAGLLPIPGGIGVVEGGLIYGLTAAGMADEAAFASVILYRLATFYLPPVWGYFALRWLERSGHL